MDYPLVDHPLSRYNTKPRTLAGFRIPSDGTYETAYSLMLLLNLEKRASFRAKLELSSLLSPQLLNIVNETSIDEAFEPGVAGAPPTHRRFIFGNNAAAEHLLEFNQTIDKLRDAEDVLGIAGQKFRDAFGPDYVANEDIRTLVDWAISFGSHGIFHRLRAMIVYIEQDPSSSFKTGDNAPDYTWRKHIKDKANRWGHVPLLVEDLQVVNIRRLGPHEINFQDLVFTHEMFRIIHCMTVEEATCIGMIHQ